jgi:hypothetical protein
MPSLNNLNQQRELDASNPESEEVAKLEEQLREAVAAENFFETATGKLFTQLVTEEVNRILKDITSDKYREDLPGYNNALSDLNAYKKILRKMQVAASPVRKAKLQERLDNGE